MIKDNLIIENARIGFRNFNGEEGNYNPAGRRNFCVFFDEADGEELEKQGWNIKWLEAREEGDRPQAYMQITVSYKTAPPKIILISSSGKTMMTEDTVGILDWAEIETVDLIINPYNWEVNGKTGVKAYVRSMYVKIIEDEFALKYSDIPMSGQSQSRD